MNFYIFCRENVTLEKGVTFGWWCFPLSCEAVITYFVALCVRKAMNGSEVPQGHNSQLTWWMILFIFLSLFFFFQASEMSVSFKAAFCKLWAPSSLWLPELLATIQYSSVSSLSGGKNPGHYYWLMVSSCLWRFQLPLHQRASLIFSSFWPETMSLPVQPCNVELCRV